MFATNVAQLVSGSDDSDRDEESMRIVIAELAHAQCELFVVTQQTPANVDLLRGLRCRSDGQRGFARICYDDRRDVLV